MKNIRILFSLVLISSFLLSACGGAKETDSAAAQDQINTAVAGTLAAVTTRLAVAEGQAQTLAVPQAATVPPTAPPAPTLGLTLTPQLEATHKPGLCDFAQYVADLTIPDGTMMPPNTPFVKTWAIKNVGTCPWTPDYTLIYTGGDMVAAGGMSVPLTDKTILPGETAHISISFIAPTEKKQYRSFWKLRNASGGIFGVLDPAGGKEKGIWADIRVNTKYYLVDNMCSATWKSSEGPLPCPGILNDPRGYTASTDAPKIEGGIIEDEPTLVMVPPPGKKDSWIVGQYPPIIIAPWMNFSTRIGCLEDNPGCDVTIRVNYSVNGGPEQKLFEKRHAYGEWETMVVKLYDMGLVGKSVAFLLYVYSGPNYERKEDKAFFFKPVLED